MLFGDLDLGALPGLRRVLSGLDAATGRHVLVDLDSVDTLSPEALGVLLGAAARARRDGGDLRLVTGLEHHLELLRWSGVDRAVRVAPTVGAAIDTA